MTGTTADGGGTGAAMRTTTAAAAGAAGGIHRQCTAFARSEVWCGEGLWFINLTTGQASGRHPQSAAGRTSESMDRPLFPEPPPQDQDPRQVRAKVAIPFHCDANDADMIPSWYHVDLIGSLPAWSRMGLCPSRVYQRHYRIFLRKA